MRNLTGKFSRKSPGTSNFVQPPLKKDDSHNKPFAPDGLKDDFLGRSEIYPEHSPFSMPNTQRIVWMLLVLVVVAFSSWICFFGPVAPLIKQYLERSAGALPLASAFTPTPTFKPEVTIPRVEEISKAENLLKSQVTLTPSATASPSPSATPTETPTETIEPSPTPVPLPDTPTPTSEVAGCVPASEIKLSAVGSTLCVSGRVIRTIDKSAGFLIILIEDPNAFYFVAYDLKFENLQKKQCVYAIGEIRQLGNNPIMVVSYSVPLQYCP